MDWRTTTSEVVLHLEPSTTAAHELRSELRRLLAGTVYEPRMEDAELAGSELVTNAVLHGRRPIVVRLTLTPERLRLAVHDSHPVSPSFSLLDPTAITGRGLMVVSATADRWGVEPAPGGKAVWMELFPVAPDKSDGADVAALLASWGDELDTDPALERVRVVLTDADVAAMTTAETYVEGILRELALVVHAPSSPSHLVEVARRVLEAAEPFDAARADLKRQLAVATAAGRARCDLELAITRRDAEVVRDYSTAMDEADRVAASGVLLGEAPTPVITATRKEYLRRILAQLSS